MKVAAVHHPKTLALKSELRLSLPAVVGHLELLWHFAAQHAPRGDIGKWSNAAIAGACYWDGDADQFVNALVDSGYADKCEKHRLIIHDWPEHCPQYVRLALKKKSLDFVSPVASTERSTEPSTEASILTKPNLTKPCNASPDGEESAETANACPHQAIIDLYHASLPALPKVRQWTTARQRFLRQRWREDPKRQSLDWWERFFAVVAESDFLCGRVTPPKDRKAFLADLEWLVRPGNFVKVLEGRYDNEK